MSHTVLLPSQNGGGKLFLLSTVILIETTQQPSCFSAVFLPIAPQGSKTRPQKHDDSEAGTQPCVLEIIIYALQSLHPAVVIFYSSKSSDICITGQPFRTHAHHIRKHPLFPPLILTNSGSESGYMDDTDGDDCVLYGGYRQRAAERGAEYPEGDDDEGEESSEKAASHNGTRAHNGLESGTI